MGFLDFIRENFFIVIIIIFGIVNFLNRAMKGEQKKQTSEHQKTNPAQGRQPQTARPVSRVPKGQVLGRMAEQVERKMEEFSSQLEQHSESTTKTLEQQQQKQYDQLKKQVQREHGAFTKKKETQPVLQHTVKRDNDSDNQIEGIGLKKNLSQKGLIESMVMLEVLGPPRALKPYRSISQQRKEY